MEVACSFFLLRAPTFDFSDSYILAADFCVVSEAPSSGIFSLTKLPGLATALGRALLSFSTPPQDKNLPLP